MKVKVKGVIFDYGGVISTQPPPEVVDRICRISGIELQDLKPDYIRFRGEFDRGTISASQYWQNVLGAHGVTPDAQKIKRLIQEDVKGWTCINEETLSFIKDIRPRVFKLGILSNMTKDCLDFVGKKFQWLYIFDVLIFSCKIGLIKPELPIYEYCLDSMGLDPDECLFIDDSEENIAAAAKRGMFTMHFKSFSLFKKELFGKYSMEL